MPPANWLQRAVRALTTPRGLLVAVGVGYFVVQVIVNTQARFVEWDEAVYLSQVTPGGVASPLGAHRARGIAQLVGVVASTGVGLVGVRTAMAALSSVGVVLSYWAWLPRLGWRAVIAAALFVTSWVAVFYGSEVQPNVLVACAVVGAVGLAGQRATGGPTMLGWGIAGWVALAAALRPIDAALVAMVAVPLLVIGRRRVFGTGAVPIMVGVAIGVTPWLVEALERFGGVVERLQSGASGPGTGIGFALREHATLLDGQLIGPDPSQTIPILGVVWWLVLAIVAVLGVRKASDLGVTVALWSAAVVAAFYLAAVVATAPRFLLPVYGLVAVPAAVGVGCIAGRVRSPILRSTAVTGVLALVVWHGAVAVTVDRDQVLRRGVMRDVAVATRVAADGRPCAVATQYGYPQIQLASGCVGMILDPDAPTSGSQIARWRAQGYVVFALTARTPGAGSFLEGEVGQPLPSGWTLFELP